MRRCVPGWPGWHAGGGVRCCCWVTWRPVLVTSGCPAALPLSPEVPPSPPVALTPPCRTRVADSGGAAAAGGVAMRASCRCALPSPAPTHHPSLPGAHPFGAAIRPATRLLYHRLDERVFAHISRLRAAHNIPSAILGALAPSPTAGVNLHQAGQAAFYQAAWPGRAQQQQPMSYGYQPSGNAPGHMLAHFRHLPPSQPVTQVPLPLPKPSKSPFPVEQLAVLEDAFRKSRTISKDDAHSLAQRLCGCVNSTTGARLPAMTELQVKNWFNNRRKALSKAALGGAAERGGWPAGGGRRGGRRGRRANMAARSRRRYDSDDDEPDEPDDDDEDGGGGGGASLEQGGDGDVDHTQWVALSTVLKPRGGLTTSPLGTAAAPAGERRTQRATAGRRLIEAGGAAAVEEANDALVEAVEARDRDREIEGRKRSRYDAQAYGSDSGLLQQRMAMAPAPSVERTMEQGDLEALEMCWASISSPTPQQVAAMAQQLALSPYLVELWYQSRHASEASAAATRAASLADGGRPMTPPGAPPAAAAAAGDTVQQLQLLSQLFPPAVGRG